MKRQIIYIVTLCTLASCSSDKPTYLEPHLSTLAASDITRTEATLNGTVSIEGDADMPQLYFKYGTTENMEKTAQAIIDKNAKESYTGGGKGAKTSVHLSNLVAGTTYYYMLQGSNGRTITTSNRMSLTTQSNEKPALGEAKILSSGPMSAIIGYDILENGGENISETGCYYELTSNEEETNSRSNDNTGSEIPGNQAQKFPLPNYEGSIGQQKLLINDLHRNATYKIWPYAISRVGEAIGSPITYTTSDAITLHEPGELSALIGDHLYEYTSLTLAGSMNGDDLCSLRKMMGRNQDETSTQGKLSHLDMTEVKIVAGGGSYGASRYTQDHVIGQGLFANCDNLIEVKLPMDATTIEKDAFSNCTALSKIEIPASVTSIIPSSGCTALQDIEVSGANANYRSQDGVLLNAASTEIVWFPMGKQGSYTLPSTIASIGDYAFKGCSIEIFTLPDNMKTLGQGAFMESKVKEVKLPENLRRIPTSGFQGCTQLKVVRTGSKLEAISDYVFDLCPLSDIYIEAKLVPTCDAHTFSTRGESFLNTCVVHVPKGKVSLYKSANGWKLFKNIKDN